jgi:RNA polymerase sigma-70 factor, ECF subfamily
VQRDLVAMAQEGDHDAFSQLAAGSIGRLYAVARLILRDGDRAEDAVQDALVQAWRDIRAVRDLDRFDAWLHRLLIRSCYRHAHRMRRRTVVELRAVREERDLVDSAPELSIEQRDQIARGLRRLPPDQRAALVLHHYLGLALWEVADILEIPVGTAKSRVNRATNAMRAALEADAREPLQAKGRAG